MGVWRWREGEGRWQSDRPRQKAEKKAERRALLQESIGERSQVGNKSEENGQGVKRDEGSEGRKRILKRDPMRRAELE